MVVTFGQVGMTHIESQRVQLETFGGARPSSFLVFEAMQALKKPFGGGRKLSAALADATNAYIGQGLSVFSGQNASMARTRRSQSSGEWHEMRRALASHTCVACGPKGQEEPQRSRVANLMVLTHSPKPKKHCGSYICIFILPSCFIKCCCCCCCCCCCWSLVCDRKNASHDSQRNRQINSPSGHGVERQLPRHKRRNLFLFATRVHNFCRCWANFRRVRMMVFLFVDFELILRALHTTTLLTGHCTSRTGIQKHSAHHVHCTPSTMRSGQRAAYRTAIGRMHFCTAHA